MRKITRILFWVFVIMLSIGSGAHAKKDYTNLFNSEYGTSGTDGGSSLGSCITCHNQIDGRGGENGYGLAYRNSGRDFVAIEPLDSDGDLYSNIEEILAGSFPGDPNSQPAQDTTPPTVTAFSVPATSASLTVPINSFTATDDVGVTGYLVTESATTPSAAASGWSASPPISHTVASPGVSTLYGWAKDAAGNVSTGLSDTVDVTSGTRADAGPDQTVAPGDTVLLDGSNSTNSVDAIAFFLWEQTAGPQVTLSDPAAAQPTFVAPDVTTGGLVLSFLLTVTDSLGVETTDTTIVNVTAGDNLPPTANAGPDQTVAEGVTVTLDGLGSSDPDGTVTSYLWEQTGVPQVTLSDATVAQPTFTAPDVGPSGASLTFQLTVTDDGGLQASTTTIVNITWLNEAPTANADVDQTVTEGNTVTLNGSNSTDPDDGIGSYLWSQTGGPPVTLSDVNSVQPTFVTPIVDSGGATLTFSLTVEDNGGLQAGDQVSVTVTDNGITGFPADVITATTFAGEPFGVKEENGGVFTRLRSIDPATMPAGSGKPEDMVFGLIDMEIKVATPGATTTVTIYLPAPVPEGYAWYKYTATNGWTDYSAYAVFSPGRDQVTLTLTDGGIGDDDGVANAVIVDPSGAGTVSSTDSTPPASTTAGNWGSGGCFIATAAYGSYLEPHVQVLRQFRDRFLLTNAVGKGFVRFYYTYSPPVANYIARHDGLRALVRWSLLPLVGLSWGVMRFGPGATLVITLLLLLVMTVTVMALFKRIRQRKYSFGRQFS